MPTRAERSGTPSTALTTRPLTVQLPGGFLAFSEASGGLAGACASAAAATTIKANATIRRRIMPSVSYGRDSAILRYSRNCVLILLTSNPSLNVFGRIHAVVRFESCGIYAVFGGRVCLRWRAGTKDQGRVRQVARLLEVQDLRPGYEQIGRAHV